MTYACEDCGFLFCRAGEVKECASCDKSHIRPATIEEAQRLRKRMEQENRLYDPVKAGDAKPRI